VQKRGKLHFWIAQNVDGKEIVGRKVWWPRRIFSALVQ